MKLIVIVLTVFSLKSCGSQKTTANMQDSQEARQVEKLSGTYAITVLGNNTKLPENAHLTFDDTKNRVSGYAGCNRFSGDYSIEGKTIKFGALISTKMYCKRFMDIENDLLRSLEKVNSFSIENSTLSILANDVVLIRASKDATIEKQSIPKYSIKYDAISRGIYKSISIKDNTLFFSNDRNSKPISRSCSAEEIELISTYLKNIDVGNLSTLEAPSKAHQFDGAAGATMSITKDGTTYQTPTFDHGKPNKAIADLVNTLIQMSEKQ